MNFFGPSRIASTAAIALSVALCAASWMPVAEAQTVAPAGTDAGAAAQGRKPSDRAIGTDTRSLLAIQRDGSQAGATLHMPGEQAALAHARYLKSFQHPIPERFVGQSSGGGGAGVVGLTPSR